MNIHLVALDGPVINATHIDTTTIVNMVVQVLIPLLVGLLTKVSTKSWIQSVLMLVLTMANQFFTGWAASGDGPFDWKTYLFNIILGAIISIAMHYGVWRPVGATSAVQNSLVKDSNPPVPPGSP